jgi:hypothetical protein
VGLFEEAKPYHGCEDYDLWLRLAKAGLFSTEWATCWRDIDVMTER